MRDATCLPTAICTSDSAPGTWSSFHVHGDPAIAPEVWAGARGWSDGSHSPAFVLGVSLGGALVILGVLRPTREGLRVRVEVLDGAQRVSGVFALHVAGSSGVVFAGDDDVAVARQLRSLPRPVIATRSWDEVWVAEQEELRLDRIDTPAFDDEAVAVTLRSGDRLALQAVAQDVRDALFAVAAMGGGGYVVH